MSTSSSGSLNSLRSESLPSLFALAFVAPAYPVDFGPPVTSIRWSGDDRSTMLAPALVDRSIFIDWCAGGTCVGDARSSDLARA